MVIPETQKSPIMEATLAVLNSMQAMQMFKVLNDALSAKPDRRSIIERVMEMVDELHTAGFQIVPIENGDGA